jgi:alkanesulfonate monooxygenase SsuD/methylene tetrahydromethanopterin reductase-like flavin-dependent oxidoreductase (luciferase family)
MSGPPAPAALPRRNPWIDAFRNRVGFGLQTFALPEDPEPGRRVIEAGILAEEAGLDAFFIGDHPGYASEAWLHLTAVAVQTSRIRLGSIVNCASYRHPAYLARLTADFDHISGGRLVLGLGIGWNAEEFAQLGIPMTPVRERQDALEEYLAIVEGVWGEEPFSFEGRQWRTTGGRVVPGPLQQPRPPLLIAGAGNRTLRQVAQFADACNFGPGGNTGAARSAEAVWRRLATLRAHCESAGRRYDDILRTHYTSWLMLAETEREALAKRDRYYPQGLTEEQQMTRIVGTPDQVAAYYQDLVDAGMQFFVCQVLDAADRETIELLAAEVMPRVRPLSS